MCAQEDQDTLLSKWDDIQKQLKEIRAYEMELRKQVLASFFPDGKIGTNTQELSLGWKLKGVYKLNYSFDESALDDVLKEMREKLGVATDALVRIKKEPAMTEIKKLGEKERLALEAALITKPGTPSLELVAPKKKGTK